ncbi:hypothetical protein Dsin_006557 [Dipteronia sinensis]|uniref:Tryptophan synthase beta chain-like PALP domain-containing protein n=1 Tax=Dipteronia sinensis TaxID=43782 RepID=A0AAE0AZU5_9ROSI|nr:hypothetical protein Dsin_006557 [Dipteronia sinensis]
MLGNGGGGSIAGIAAYVKRVSSQVKIIGLESTDAYAMALSLQYGERVMLDQVGGFADGVAVKEVGEETFRICKGIGRWQQEAVLATVMPEEQGVSNTFVNRVGVRGSHSC